MKKFKFIFLVLLMIFVLSSCTDNKNDNDKEETGKADFTIQIGEYIGIGKTIELKALDSNGNEVAVTWSIDDEFAATLEGNNLTGVSSGLVTVTATNDGKSAEAYVVVDKVKQVTQTFELYGGTCEIPTEYYETQGLVLPTPVKEGYNFLGWYSNANFAGNKITVIASDSKVKTLYACWHSVKFEVKFVLTTDDGEETYTEEDLFAEDYVLNAPEYDANEKVFSGWYTDSRLYNKIDYVAKGTNEDITVYGVLLDKDTTIEVNLSAKEATYDKSSNVTNNKVDIKVGSNAIPTPQKENYTFVGWFKDSKYTIPVENLYVSCYIYGKFDETYPVQSINISNAVDELVRKETLQIEYTLTPSNASVKDVTYETSDETIAKIDKYGVITALKEGEVTITLKSGSESEASATFIMKVCDAEYFNVSYDTNSYVKVGETIKLNALYNTKDHKEVALKWKSNDENVATVSNGVVTGVGEGYTKVRVYLEKDATKYFDFGVTVFDDSTNEASKFIMRANSNNIYSTYQLGIGAGGPAYYTDIVGSVSKILFKDYVVDTTYEAVQAGISSNHGGKKTSTEYITVHYTGNMKAGATGKGNADYFASGGNGTSIHYVTGNDGIWSCLDDDLIGFHAGDSTGEASEAAWYPTGVMYQEGDSIYPTWGISENSKYTLNGQETSITVPTGKTTETERVTEDKWINNMGFGYKIVNGEYYMGKTWWCYTQVSEGRLCNKGGNMNSVGIESAVNEGSDLWYTWQITAQLVAHLMIKYDLPIQRVVGHHFFSAKNCPQPMLENNMEIWWEFIELVKAEYERFTTFKDYTFEMEVVDGDIADYGRTSDALEYKIFTYKVKISKGGKLVDTVTLSSIVKGQYCF